MKRPAVAVVEKDNATREMYRRELADVYDVVTCTNAMEIWHALNQDEIDVIVVEPEGLECNKWELLQGIRSNSRKPNTPVILCSIKEEFDRDFKEELAACLTKPMLPASLLHVIQGVLLTLSTTGVQRDQMPNIKARRRK